jgi:hypothetical protein
VKVNCVKRGITYGFSIYELEVYGSPVPAAQPSKSDYDEVAAEDFINVYPNPAMQAIQVRIPSDCSGCTSVRLINAFSQVVKTETVIFRQGRF